MYFKIHVINLGPHVFKPTNDPNEKGQAGPGLSLQHTSPYTQGGFLQKSNDFETMQYTMVSEENKQLQDQQELLWTDRR